MISPILPIQHVQSIELTSPSVATGQPGEFQSMLAGAIGQVEQSQQTAHQAVQGFLSGENEELHTTALATQKAELQFEMFLQVRNKMVSAYQEVMKLQV
jgi:flagellar hook-basal body complex protein FliE